MLAKKRYLETLRRLENDRLAYDEVDDFKDEMRDYLAGKVTVLSRGAQEHLAGYAVYCGVVPRDPVVKSISEGILGNWREHWGVDTKLEGPLRSNNELIKRTGKEGIVYDGWLDMTSRLAGRPEHTGNFQLSLVALGCAIDELSICWDRSNFGSKEKGKPSPAARFYYRHIAKFVPNLDVEDINYLLVKRQQRNRNH